MTRPDSLSVHAKQVDACLRRLRVALEPLALAIEGSALVRGPDVAHVSAPLAVWQHLHAALLDCEPWPIELIGPVQVDWNPGDVPLGEATRTRPGWFSRGHHQPDVFLAYARLEARRAGIPIRLRPVLSTQQCFHTWFADYPDRGWQPASAQHPGSVPVTVWVPAEGTA